jgi:hypothetical protein
MATTRSMTEWLERLTANAKVATVMGMVFDLTASSDTVRAAE